MSTLSIRKLPRALERALARETRRQRKSKTDIVVDALKNAFHLGERQQRAQQLHRFFRDHRTTPADETAFHEAMKDFEQIDEELWR